METDRGQTEIEGGSREGKREAGRAGSQRSTGPRQVGGGRAGRPGARGSRKEGASSVGRAGAIRRV